MRGKSGGVGKWEYVGRPVSGDLPGIPAAAAAAAAAAEMDPGK